ncbi:MAG: hypothetical protein FIA92_07855 [Chloroflexi bacterium]|nr:hypothetical protein [Chloroflexota bacterium]
MLRANGTSAGGSSRFALFVEPRYRWLLRLFGVRDGNAWVELGDDLHARFGWFDVRTPLGNCVHWSIEGPWRAITALGVRRSFRGGDLTFGGTPRGGGRIDFRDRVPFAFFRIPALYVTVADLEGFAAALTENGIPGEDRRRQHP